MLNIAQYYYTLYKYHHEPIVEKIPYHKFFAVCIITSLQHRWYEYMKKSVHYCTTGSGTCKLSTVGEYLLNHYNDCISICLPQTEWHACNYVLSRNYCQ